MTISLPDIDSALDEVRANVDHAEAQYNPWALSALRVAEQLRAEVERLTAIAEAATAWRHMRRNSAGIRPKPESAALIEAVDAYAAGGTR